MKENNDFIKLALVLILHSIHWKFKVILIRGVLVKKIINITLKN